MTQSGHSLISIINCMTFEEARKLVKNKINLPDPCWPDKPEMVVVDENTIEKSWGWVFFYESSLYLESKNISDALAGNAPLIVNKDTDEIFETGTAYPLEQYIQEYEDNIGLAK